MANPKPPESSTASADTDKDTNAPSTDMLDMVMAQALGLAMHNAVNAQQNAQILNSAIVAATCTRILSAKNMTDENITEDIAAAVDKVTRKK